MIEFPHTLITLPAMQSVLIHVLPANVAKKRVFRRIPGHGCGRRVHAGRTVPEHASQEGEDPHEDSQDDLSGERAQIQQGRAVKEDKEQGEGDPGGDLKRVEGAFPAVGSAMKGHCESVEEVLEIFLFCVVMLLFYLKKVSNDDLFL